MKLETLRWRKFSRACLGIVFIYVAQRFQNIAALFWEVCGYRDELAATVRQAVGQQDLSAVAQFRRVARQGITHLNGRAELCYAVLQYVAQIFPGVLAPSEVQRYLFPLLGGHDRSEEHTSELQS